MIVLSVSLKIPISFPEAEIVPVFVSVVIVLLSFTIPYSPLEEIVPELSKVPILPPEKFFKPKKNYNEKPIETEMIMEFSPNIFEAPVLDGGLNSEKDISADDSKSNNERFE